MERRREALQRRVGVSIGRGGGRDHPERTCGGGVEKPLVHLFLFFIIGICWLIRQFTLELGVSVRLLMLSVRFLTKLFARFHFLFLFGFFLPI